MRLSNPITLANLPDTASGGDDFTPIPAGIYEAEIVKCEERVTKAGTGTFLNLRCDITDGEYAGRVIFGTITLTNPNPKAVEIGQGQARALLKSVGMEQFQDTDQLVGRRLKIKVAIEKQEGYDPRNTIKAYRPIGNMVGKIQPSPREQQPAPTVNVAKDAAAEQTTYGYDDSTPF